MYNTNLLHSASDCEALLNMVSSSKDDLLFRKTSLEVRLANQLTLAVEIDEELNACKLELNTVNTLLSATSDSKLKDKLLADQKRLQYLIHTLTQRKNYYGTFAALGIELKVAKIKKELEAIAVFMREIETRKGQF